MTDEISVKVKGIPEAIEKLKKYQGEKIQAAKDELKKVGFKIELAAKEIATEKGVVDTGRLRASITTNWSGSTLNRAQIKNPIRDPKNPSKSEDAIGRPDGPKDLVLVVGTNVNYARIQEFGSPKMSGRPFLFPAHFMHEGELLKGFKKLLKEK